MSSGPVDGNLAIILGSGSRCQSPRGLISDLWGGLGDWTLLVNAILRDKPSQDLAGTPVGIPHCAF